MEISVKTWVTFVLGVFPLVGCLVWWWNDIWFGLNLKFRGGFDGGGGDKYKLPPGHMGIPFFGETFRFLWYFKVIRRPDEYINSKRRKYGDGEGMYRSHLFGSPTIIAWSPSLSKYILNSGESFEAKWPTEELLGRSALATLQGKAHTRLKTCLSKAINQPAPLRRIALMVQPSFIAALESWAQKGTINGYKEAKKVTFESVGKYFANIEPGPVLDTLDELFAGLLAGLRAFPLKLPGTSYYYAFQCKKKAIEILRKELEKKKKQQKDGWTKTNDVMDGMMQLKDEEGNQLTDLQVLENIVGFVVAGYESTSLATMWALYFLPKYPAVLQKLREENMNLSKSKNGELITSDDISKLTYTNKVVEETIRMANIAPTIFRSATRDIVYKGYKIPKGWRVIVWLRYLHTNPENFDSPMCFNPDRWNEPAKAGAYQVFGSGPRMCPGNMLARLEVAIFLHYLAAGYNWELVNPRAKMSYLSHPKPVDGVEIKFSKL